MNDIKRFYGGQKEALNTIKAAFHSANLIRISTAYFEPSGYQILQDVLINKEIKLLIGREQGGVDRFRDIIKEFEDGLSVGDWENRQRAMRQMLEYLQRGILVVQVGDDPVDTTSYIDGRYLYQHAKLYIADEYVAIVTSANMSSHGLVTSREAGEPVTDPVGVKFFIDNFEKYFTKARDITQELIEKLKAFLDHYDPYIIYARVLLELYSLPEDEVPLSLPILADYQRPAVTRVKNNIEEHGGSFFIASTGLGKTVMAAHIVAYTRMLGLVDNAIVICPAGLREMWQRFMRMSRTSSIEFSYRTLSAENNKNNRFLRKLIDELKDITDKTLVIIDESHNLRNDDDGDRLRNQRLYNAVRKKNARVLLLTATPFSKNMEDVNAQLRILPAPKQATSTALGIETDASSWQIAKSSELSELPPCFVLTTPTVVKYFSHLDENGERYVQFSKNDRRYFPRRLQIRTIYYENPYDDFLQELLKNGLLNSVVNTNDHQPRLFEIDEFIQGNRNPLFESQIVHQFCSSPAKIQDFCKKALNGFPNIKFARQEELTEFINVNSDSIHRYAQPPNDTKLQKLLQIIAEAKGEKVVVFCIYEETAKSLTKYLKEYFQNQINIETAVGYKDEKLDEIIQHFAPVANEVSEDLLNNPISVLVLTGRLSEGYNLQDAAILVNYDLPWTVLQLAQRMGRILRPWHTPREITVYNFIPSTMKHAHYMAVNWGKRLINYNEQYQSFSDIPVLLRELGQQEDNWEMIELARSLQTISDVNLDLEQLMEFIANSDNLQTTSFYDDLARISYEDVAYIRNLPPGIRSARLTKGKRRLFILFKYRKNYYPALFDSASMLKLGNEDPDAIMNEIRCEKSEYIVPFNIYPDEDMFDSWIEKSKQTWAKHYKIDETYKIQVICSMALIPFTKNNEVTT